MKNLKIGVTISLKSLGESIWTNGVRLNTLIFARMLQQSSENYQVYVLNVATPDSAPRSRFLDGVEFHSFEEKFCEMDLIVQIGAAVSDQNLLKFKSSGPNKKVVSYHCGNDYILLIESILFKDSEKLPYNVGMVKDEIWYVPQQHDTNSGFYSTIYRTNAVIVPFIWDEHFLKMGLEDVTNLHLRGKMKRDWPYQAKESKNIGILEPNINIVKFGLIPLLIAEECYRGEIGRKHINRVLVTNAEKLKSHRQFLSIAETLDVFRDKKLSAEMRFPVSFLLTQYVDVLVCHQLLNPLNYLYLDAAYMGRPVLHNAPLVRDLGYYYEASDTKGGARELNRILTEHDQNQAEYKARTQAVLERYHASNPKVIATYDRLIERLFSGGNHNLRYNPATNLYEGE